VIERARPGGTLADASAAACPAARRAAQHASRDQPRQEDEPQAVRRGEHRPLDLAVEDHELVAQERVLGEQRGLRPGQIADGAPATRPRRGLRPREEAPVDGAQRLIAVEMVVAMCCSSNGIATAQVKLPIG